MGSEIQKAKYVRLYADEVGESHFEDLEMDLLPVEFAPPAGPMNIAEFLPTTRSLWVGVPGGWAVEIPHPVPRRQIFIILRCEFEVTASDSGMSHLRPGNILLIEDTWGKVSLYSRN